MSLSKNIRLKYKRKAVYSLLFLFFLLFLWILYPFQEFFSPRVLSDNPLSAPDENASYVEINDITLYYTGYCNRNNTHPDGYFYYGFSGEKCLLFLLSGNTCNQGQESIPFSSIRGTVYRDSDFFEQITAQLAEELDWDQSSLADLTEPYLINEAGYHYGYHIFLLVVYTLVFCGTFFKCVLNLSCMSRPGLSLLPVCGFSPRRAERFLLLAEKEKNEHCLFTAENFVITRRFILDCSRGNPFIIPIKKLLWVYEHSQVSGLPGRHGKITYTLTFYDTRKRAVHSTRHTREAADTILSYLKDYYPDILNGYTDENKKTFRELA